VKLAAWSDMLPLARNIYDRHPTGCCWHITLDDGNVSDDSVEFCTKNAAERKCAPCVALSPLMQAATVTQRRKLYRNGSFFR
jgi:hypothetical protein